MHWELDVVKGGTYEVSLGYLCAKADAGSKIRVKIGTEKLDGAIRGTPLNQIPLPHRVPGNNWYVNREWKTLTLGRVDLETGRTQIQIEAQSVAGRQVMDLKHAVLRRVK